MSTRTTGPQVGDRVQVTLTGTVLVRYDGRYPSVQIELDPDIVSGGDFCPACGEPGVACEDPAHAWRDQVTTHADPAEVMVLAPGQR